MGRFLKESGKNDKTRAGKMMTAVGKSLSYSGQQRLTMRMPLLRLYQVQGGVACNLQGYTVSFEAFMMNVMRWSVVLC